MCFIQVKVTYNLVKMVFFCAVLSLATITVSWFYLCTCYISAVKNITQMIYMVVGGTINHAENQNKCWSGADRQSILLSELKVEYIQNACQYSWMVCIIPLEDCKEEPELGWQMCCAAGTQVLAHLMSKGRPCGLNSLICCHHTYDESILGSVLVGFASCRT